MREITLPTGKRIAKASGLSAACLAWGLVSTLTLGGGAAAAAAPAVTEHWYRIELDGTPSGYEVDREERGGEEITSLSRLQLSLRRGEAEIHVAVESRFVETLDGRALRASTRMQLGQIPVETSYTFGEDKVIVHQSQNGEVRDEERPLPTGEWLTPARLEARTRELLRSGAESFALRALDLTVGLEPITTRWTLEERGVELVLDEGTFETSRWQQVPENAPQLAMLSDLDADGRLIRSQTAFMGLAMTIVLSSREAALVPPTRTPELMVRSFVRPDRPIERPRQTRRVVYEVRTADGSPLPELPSAGDQRVEGSGAARRVTVELGSSPRLEGVDPVAYLGASTFISSTDRHVRELLEKAERDLASPPRSTAERAELLRRFVAGYLVEKDLDTGFATAAEVAATRSGDCTEHAVLLAALLRAAGIPSRLVAGLVYVERFAGARDVFGYHMWTEALVEQRWIDLDATLAAPFDAAHLALVTTALDDGQADLAELAKIAPLLGKLEVRVLAEEGAEGAE